MTKLDINNESFSVDAPADMPLLWVLRDALSMTGTKFGCGIAQCGACTVHLDGHAVRSCVFPIAAVEGHKITTIEGIEASEVGKKVQAAWLKWDVPQCGYCQSGQIMSACALLAANPAPHRRRYRRGNGRQYLSMRNVSPHSGGHQIGGGRSMMPDGLFAPDASAPQAPERRAFLRLGLSATGALMLGFSFQTFAGQPETVNPLDVIQGDADVAPRPGVFEPNAFVQISSSGEIVLVMPKVEMGQGIYTAIAMLIAEELEVSLDSVTLEHAPPDAKLYTDPALRGQATGGSRSIRYAWEPMRKAGAATRILLVNAAAQHWNVPVDTCRAKNGQVMHEASGRAIPYGALVEAASRLPIPQNVPLKDPKDFTIVGQPVKRLDSPIKVDGRAKFGIDAQLPGMRYAAIVNCPVFGGSRRRWTARWH